MYSAPLPYDAEIDYLSTDGNAYINLGITTQDMYKIECKVYGLKGNGYICGRGDTSTTNLFGILYSGSTNGIDIRTGSSGEHVLSNTYGRDVNLIVYKTGAQAVGISSVLYNDWTESLLNLPLYLFALNRGWGVAGVCQTPIKIYSFAIYDSNNIPLMDLIPVRVGQVGYMYDQVSRRLFGNAGTGDFVLGPDVQ
jgi:hypothetical protein